MAKKKNSFSPSRRFIQEYQQADKLIDSGKFEAALEILRPLQRKYPKNRDVLRLLGDVYQRLRMTVPLQAVLEELASLDPKDPEIAILLAQTCLENSHPTLALNHYRRYVERWPAHGYVAKASQIILKLEQEVEKLMSNQGLTGPDGFDLLVQHEEVHSALEGLRLDEAERKATALLERAPYLVAVRNNLSLVFWLQGELPKAIETARKALEFKPDNLHALGNLARFLFLSGEAETAREIASRVKEPHPKAADRWVKKVETLSYLGDDAGVLEVYQDFKATATGPEKEFVHPNFYHLVAVAALRQGDEKQARSLWKEALKRGPGLKIARENLADLQKPVGERNGPWAFSTEQWLAGKLAVELRAIMEKLTQRKKFPIVTPMRELVALYPELRIILPVVLQRGDQTSRAFAVLLITTTEIPELVEALRAFVLGQGGSDEQRMDAAQRLSGAGHLSSGSHRLWLDGEWKDILLLNFEVSPEPVDVHSRKVTDLVTKAFYALNEHDPDRAEELLNAALAEAPDAPEILNNLAVAYYQQGRTAEAEALTRRIIEEHPEYLFGQINEAHRLIRANQLDQAADVLDPLMQRKKLHTSEFHALAVAQIELALARGIKEAANSWLDMLAQVEPDHPDILEYRMRLKLASIPDKLNELKKRMRS